MRYISKIVSFFVVTPFLLSVNAQVKFRAVQWGLKDGLSQACASSMLKDVNGFLWIGTQGELSRFDGSTFKNYYHESKKTGTISAGNTGGGMVEDSLHNIWIGTDKGVYRYDIKADTFTHFLPATPYAIVFWATRDEVFCIESNSLVTAYNIHSFSKKTLATLTSSDSTGYGILSSFYDVRTNSIWILRGHSGSYGGPPGGGLLQISLARGEKKYYDWQCYKKNPGHHHGSESMCYDRKRNCLWINSWEGLMQFTLADNQFHYIGALNSLLDAEDYGHWVGISLDLHNRVWMATKPKGIVIYDPTDQSVTFPFAEDTTLQRDISDYNATIYCDRDGMVWTGFWLRKGIYQILPFSPVARHYRANPKQQHSLSVNNVNSIVSAGHGKVWIGSHEGALNIFNYHTGLFEVLGKKDFPDINMKTLIVPVSMDTLAEKVWLGTDEGLFETDMVTKKGRPVIYKSQDAQIIPALKDPISKSYRKKIIVIGSYGDKQRIFIVNNDTNIAQQVLSFADNTVNPFFTLMAGDSLIFVKGWNDPRDNQTYRNIKGKWVHTPTPVDGIEWTAIKSDEKDLTFWVAGERRLFHFDKNFHIIREYAHDNGLPEFKIMSLIPDNKGNIWFNTDRSIHQLNIKTGVIATLSEKDGFEKQDFSPGTSAEIDPNGNIYFPGGVYGLGFIQINPNNFMSSSSSTYLKSLEINQIRYPLSTGVNSLQEITLQHFENQITLETGIMDFYSKGSSNIRYKLEGLNNSWQYGPANYTIRYDKLPPKKYKLVMQASNAANEFNGPTKTLFININPPFWKTWWFVCLGVVITFLIMHALFQFRLKEKMKVLVVRQTLHRDLHDDVGATLSSIKIYSELLQGNADNTLMSELIKTNAADMMDKLEIIAWSTNPQHDTFKSFKELINKYGSALCYAKQVELDLEYDGLTDSMIMPGEVRRNLFLVFKEAINNLIKHSEASQCKVKIGIGSREFHFEISDNGNGFSGGIKGNGSGWKNMHKRCEELHGKIIIESQAGKGTIISIRLPFPFKNTKFMG